MVPFMPDIHLLCSTEYRTRFNKDSSSIDTTPLHFHFFPFIFTDSNCFYHTKACWQLFRVGNHQLLKERWRELIDGGQRHSELFGSEG